MKQNILTTASDGNSLFHSFLLNDPPEFHRYSVKQGPLANSNRNFKILKIIQNYTAINCYESYTLYTLY